MKVAIACETCQVKFEAYQSNKRKYCSKQCNYRGYLKDPSSALGVSPAQRQARFRAQNPTKIKDSCPDCGISKSKISKRCQDCSVLARTGEKSPYFKGGYENHLKHNRQRARNIKILGEHTPLEWEALKIKYNHMCLCCKQQEPFVALSRDHIIPLSLGGRNEITNIQPLCRSCNSRKRAKIINYIELHESVGAGL